jgi:hypothetical protein
MPSAGGDLLSEDKLDALCLDERNKTVAVLSCRAAHLSHGGKLRASGLLHVNDVSIAEASQNARI